MFRDYRLSCSPSGATGSRVIRHPFRQIQGIPNKSDHRDPLDQDFARLMIGPIQRA